MGSGGRQEGGGGSKGAARVSIRRLATLGSGSGLFGREADTAWLDAAWSTGASVASVVAFGGVGKSALVWDWLSGMKRDGWRRGGRAAVRVYGWSFYSQGTKEVMTSADLFIGEALRWFGDPHPNEGSPWDKGERLATLTRERATLLVLDGLEPLQWGWGPEEGRIKDPALATLVRELGGQNPGMCLITSRLPVRDVEDLTGGGCPRRDLSTLTEEAGVALLRARNVRGPDEELRAAVREYGGHGLALALLGSYLDELAGGAGGEVTRRHEIGPLVEAEHLGGHARRVMTAYETMLGAGSVEASILGLLGLFDRPADEGEIEALRAPPAVPGLTEALAGLGGRDWNRAIARLRRLGLLGQAESEKDRRLDAHPLVREGFQYCDLLFDQGRDTEVQERAAQALEIAERNHWLLEIALDHLSLGRAHLLSGRGGACDDLAQAVSYLSASVDGLRRAGQQDYLPLGLLARAALHTQTRAFALARKDLDEALTLATRCGFRLQECDAHLGFTRLALAEGDATQACASLEHARKIIEATSYHRRDGELRELMTACR